ncbi:RND efflux membrane fusion protein [Alcanivorax hongdengensis A-11-3]|uniref:RND efflux membrane fusion protein n=2 Tax=Alcanivorax hongdengensis TaxID=519051 RepID=L0W8L4_9GAMM|nr:RND efflux membrane fusion protein [Alcanivorax hongdengensis A-11-3]
MLALAALVLWWLSHRQSVAPVARPAAVVNLAPVISRELTDTVEVVGNARAADAITLVAEVPGRVSSLHFQEGQQVAKGVLLVTLDARESKARLAGAQAEFDRARQDYQRGQTLMQRRAISQAEVDTYRTTLESARANLDAAQANYNDHFIKAPYAGVVGLRQVDPGTYLNAGDAVTTLDNLDYVDVDFQVPERYLGRMKKQLPVTATSDAYPGTAFQGRIARLDTRIQADSRSLRARARLHNPGHRLRQGQFLRVVVQLGQRPARLVPEQAIITQGAQSYVFTVSDGEARRHPVTLGGRREGWVEVRQGLAAASRVIVNGHARLGSGDPVQVVDNPQALMPEQQSLLEEKAPADPVTPSPAPADTDA